MIGTLTNLPFQINVTYVTYALQKGKPGGRIQAVSLISCQWKSNQQKGEQPSFLNRAD
jgi:hypothetical protein